MEVLLKRLGISIEHLRCLDEVFRINSPLYNQMEVNMTRELGTYVDEIGRELYAGGKQTRGNPTLARQMILGDVIEYIFTGRAYYHAARSEENFRKFSILVLYCVNQLLLFDTITVNPILRRAYIEKLEEVISLDILYEKDGDRALARTLKTSPLLFMQAGWDPYANFVDSLLPKTLGCPKELVVFLELIRLQKGLIIPLLLIQRLFGGGKKIAPPDVLILKRNRESFGIEVGYKKEEQSREFSIQTSIPTFAIDLKNNMHNRCQKCGENILYCDSIIKKYAEGTLLAELDGEGRYRCGVECQNFDGTMCRFANYYGKYRGPCFYGQQTAGDDRRDMHYHATCVLNDVYIFRNRERPIREHITDFFCQIPEIEDISSL